MGESCYSGIRFIVIFFNFIFILCSCGIVSFGIYVQVEKGDYAAVSNTRGLTSSAARLLIVVGVITAVISFMGCLGAYRKKKVLFWIIVVLIGLTLFAMSASFILSSIYQRKLKDELKGDMMSSLEEYGQDGQDGITEGWDWVQRKFECCGVNSTKNWFKYYVKANGSHNVVPDSCCVVEIKNCGNPFQYSNGTIINDIYKKGCYPELKDFSKNHILIIGIVVAVFVVIQPIGMFLVFLFLDIKNGGMLDDDVMILGLLF